MAVRRRWNALWLLVPAVVLLLALPATAVPLDDPPDDPTTVSTEAADPTSEPTADTATDTATDAVRAEMEQHWQDLGGAAGPLSEPVGDPFAITGGNRWNFAGGALFRADPPDAEPGLVTAVLGSTLQRYDQYDGPAGVLGYPLADPVELAEIGDPASSQEFKGGAIYASTSTGAHALTGPILARYLALGGADGQLGLPVTDEVDAAMPGSRQSRFEHGRIYWSVTTGAQHIWGAILGRYLRLGGPSGHLGLPTTGEIDVPGISTRARQNNFQHGRIYWSPRTGARHIWGAILGRYLRLGGPSGHLGLPTTGEIDVPGISTRARQNNFQRGRIYWSARTGAHHVWGGILQRYIHLGSAGGALGLPLSGERAVRTGVRQAFEGPSLLWDRRAHRAFLRLRFSAPAQRVTAADLPYTWRPGCPVPPAGLRMLRVVHRGWNGDDRVGRLVVSTGAVTDIRAVFRRAHAAGFRIRQMVPADRWRGSDVRAMEHDSTNAFNCRHVTGNPYRLSQHSYGNAIDINSFENPYVTGSRVYPNGSTTYLNRSWVRKGMIVRAGVVARTFASLGWPWGARWSNPDYQHFSSNGG